MPTREHADRASRALAHQPHWVWRYALVIILPLFGVFALLFGHETHVDWGRSIAWALGAYIVLLAAKIATVNYGVRREMSITGAPWPPFFEKVVKGLPAHIACLAIGTILYVGLLSSAMIAGDMYESFPWLVVAAHIVVILGLNYIRRIVLLRRERQGR